MSAEVRVRHATIRDFPPLAMLAQRSFVAAYRDKIAESLLLDFTRREMSPEALATTWQEDGAIVLVAELGDDPTIVGYAELHPVAHGRDGRTVELTRVYLDAEHTGQGHGSRLLQAGIDEATQRGFRTLRLGVWAHNLGAQRFYRRWGFQVVGEDHFQLGPERQTDLVMERPL